MMKLRGLLLAASLAITPSAFAIPLGVQIVGGTGDWNLSGASNLSDSWFAAYDKTFDILPGSYLWSIDGLGVLGATWSLELDGKQVYSDSALGLLFKIDDQYRFTVEPATSVPEPAVLSLFGVGLAALGFLRRRRLQS